MVVQGYVRWGSFLLTYTLKLGPKTVLHQQSVLLLTNVLLEKNCLQVQYTLCAYGRFFESFTTSLRVHMMVAFEWSPFSHFCVDCFLAVVLRHSYTAENKKRHYTERERVQWQFPIRRSILFFALKCKMHRNINTPLLCCNQTYFVMHVGN